MPCAFKSGPGTSWGTGQRFIWTSKGTHLAMQALKVLQAARAGFFSDINHCLCSHSIAVVLSVIHLNETRTRRYILSKQARFQLGPSENYGVVTEQLAKLLWRLVSHEILQLPLASCWEKGDQCYRVCVTAQGKLYW